MAASLSVEPELPPEPAEPFGTDEPEPLEPFRPEDRAPVPRLSPAALSPAPRPRGKRSSPLLPSAPALFPWIARRFAPGEVTIWTGSPAAVEPLLELLYVGAADVRGRISLLEGANRFHPYRIGELARAFELDPTETVRRIRLARAFTAYQMVALVERWAPEVRRHTPTLLIGHDLPALFTDDELPREERTALLRHVAKTLAALLARTGVPLLLTLGPDGVAGFPGLTDQGLRWSDYVTIERGPASLRLRALRDDARLTLIPRPAGQVGLEAFGGGSAEEVIAWDVPPRRTVRRSRNG